MRVTTFHGRDLRRGRALAPPLPVPWRRTGGCYTGLVDRKSAQYARGLLEQEQSPAGSVGLPPLGGQDSRRRPRAAVPPLSEASTAAIGRSVAIQCANAP